MKKLLLLSIAASLSAGAMAQNTKLNATDTRKSAKEFSFTGNTSVGAKTTAVGDSFVLSPFGAMDTITYYTLVTDSGALYGTNALDRKGFAQRYNVNSADSTIKVIGVVALFGGTIDPATTKTVTFHAWSEGPRTTWVRPTLFNSGLPNTSLASLTAPVKSLGIDQTSANDDTTKLFFFSAPTTFLRNNFFMGYTTAYTWATLGADTFGLYSSKSGQRSATGYTVIGTDTIVNNHNTTQYTDGTWHDNLQDNFRVGQNVFIRPVVVVGPSTAGFKGVTQNNFTFLGNYPNPAVNSTNIRFALAKGTDVTIQIMDLSGRVISTINKTGFGAGEHNVAVETANLPAGEYVYIIRTGENDGIASKMTVIK